MMFNVTFNNISAITWLLVLLMEETGVPGENYRPATCHWLYHKMFYRVHLAISGQLVIKSNMSFSLTYILIEWLVISVFRYFLNIVNSYRDYQTYWGYRYEHTPSLFQGVLGTYSICVSDLGIFVWCLFKIVIFFHIEPKNVFKKCIWTKSISKNSFKTHLS